MQLRHCGHCLPVCKQPMLSCSSLTAHTLCSSSQRPEAPSNLELSVAMHAHLTAMEHNSCFTDSDTLIKAAHVQASWRALMQQPRWGRPGRQPCSLCGARAEWGPPQQPECVRTRCLAAVATNLCHLFSAASPARGLREALGGRQDACVPAALCRAWTACVASLQVMCNGYEGQLPRSRAACELLAATSTGENSARHAGILIAAAVQRPATQCSVGASRARRAMHRSAAHLFVLQLQSACQRLAEC